MRQEVLMEKLYTALISGNRQAARDVVDGLLQVDCPADKILSHLFWPVLESMQNLHRRDQLCQVGYNYGTRILRMLADQMQPRLHQGPRRHKTVLVTCGAEESEELVGQLVSDLLEGDGYDVYFAGGGVANDEIVQQLGQLNADILVVFGALPATVPYTRQIIDHLHEVGVCPKLQIAVGGGVFNRADGLAEEIGADLWAKDPVELVEMVSKHPEKRMTADQRTVGRKTRPNKQSEAA